MLDQLTAAAGFAPVEDGAAGTAGADEQESVREFLDQQRSGWGAKFAAVFEEISKGRDEVRSSNGVSSWRGKRNGSIWSAAVR